jgi:hypothetical protein
MENEKKNNNINPFVGVMSLLLHMRIPTDVMIWLITLTIFTDEEKSCLIDTCVEISEELREIRQEEKRENSKKVEECSQKRGFLKRLYK